MTLFIKPFIKILALVAMATFLFFFLNMGFPAKIIVIGLLLGFMACLYDLISGDYDRRVAKTLED